MPLVLASTSCACVLRHTAPWPLTSSAPTLPFAGQDVKSRCSSRMLPVPRQVLRPGFEDYFADLDALGATDLFPGLEKAEDRPGVSISHWYNNRLRRELGITDKPVTLHCLRYLATVADYSNVPAFLLDTLFGQSKKPHIRMTGGEMLREAKYINEPTPLDLRDALDQMCFPELDITPYTRGRFDLPHLRARPSCSRGAARRTGIDEAQGLR